MPSGTGPNPLAVLAGTEIYLCNKFTRLKQVPEAVDTVVAALSAIGVSAPDPSINPRREQLCDRIRDAAQAADVVIVYYTGHGIKPAGDEYYIITADSRTPLAQTESAFTPARWSSSSAAGTRRATWPPTSRRCC